MNMKELDMLDEFYISPLFYYTITHTSGVGAGVGADLDLLLPPPFAGYNTDAAIDIDPSDSSPLITLG